MIWFYLCLFTGELNTIICFCFDTLAFGLVDDRHDVVVGPTDGGGLDTDNGITTVVPDSVTGLTFCGKIRKDQGEGLRMNLVSIRTVTIDSPSF